MNPIKPDVEEALKALEAKSAQEEIFA